MGRKEDATSFLQLASAGKVRKAYEKHIHPDFIHHNIYFKGDRESFLIAMEENAREYPNKKYQTLRTLEDGDLVAVHGRVDLSPEMVFGVIHIFRFADDKIIEAWEASQQTLKDSPNEHGLF